MTEHSADAAPKIRRVDLREKIIKRAELIRGRL